MPSPVGHFIGGVAAGWLVSGAPRALAPKSWRRSEWRDVAIFGSLGVLPDFDLLFGAHREASHSIAAACVAGALVWAIHRTSVRPASSRKAVLFAIACAAAYGSHVLLDWLATDTSAPFGVMAFWPFDSRYYESDLHLFLPISRRYHELWAFTRHNTIALARELLILLPLLTLVGLLRRRRAGPSGS